MLCGTNLNTENGGESVTKELFKRLTIYGDEGFLILDTPGTGTDKDKIMHAVSLRSALIEGPINGILITIKYDRDALIINKIRNHLSLLGDTIGGNKVVDHTIIIITNSDSIK